MNGQTVTIPAFLLRHKWAAGLLLFLLVWLLGFHLWASALTRRPLDQPISLAPRGSVDVQITIPLAESYYLELVFPVGELSREELFRLVGNTYYFQGVGSPSGIPVPVRWALSIQSGTVVASLETESFGVWSHTGSTLNRQIGLMRAPRGSYRFQAEIMRDVPEFSRVPTRIATAFHGKGWATWQFDVIFFGSLLNLFLIMPAAGALFLWLLWSLWRSLRRPS
jgi:uncharacterized protein DUF5625